MLSVTSVKRAARPNLSDQEFDNTCLAAYALLLVYIYAPTGTIRLPVGLEVTLHVHRALPVVLSFPVGKCLCSSVVRALVL